MVLKGLKKRDGTEGVNQPFTRHLLGKGMTLLKGLKGHDGTEGVKGTCLKVSGRARGVLLCLPHEQKGRTRCRERE